MKFGELRNLIYQDCLVVYKDRNDYVLTHQPTKYDDYEVIGIRSKSYLVVSVDDKR